MVDDLSYFFSPAVNHHLMKTLATSGGGTYQYYNNKTKSNWQSKVSNRHYQKFMYRVKIMLKKSERVTYKGKHEWNKLKKMLDFEKEHPYVTSFSQLHFSD